MHQPGLTMQPDPNRLLTLSPETAAYIAAQRPELANALQGHTIALHALLAPPATLPAISSVTYAPSVLSPSPSAGLGDLVATILRHLRITAAVALLQRRGWLSGDCGCPARQAHLNAITPRLLAMLHPWPLTASTALAWMVLLLLLTRL